MKSIPVKFTTNVEKKKKTKTLKYPKSHILDTFNSCHLIPTKLLFSSFTARNTHMEVRVVKINLYKKREPDVMRNETISLCFF